MSTTNGTAGSTGPTTTLTPPAPAVTVPDDRAMLADREWDNWELARRDGEWRPPRKRLGNYDAEPIYRRINQSVDYFHPENNDPLNEYGWEATVERTWRRVGPDGTVHPVGKGYGFPLRGQRTWEWTVESSPKLGVHDPEALPEAWEGRGEGYPTPAAARDAAHAHLAEVRRQIEEAFAAAEAEAEREAAAAAEDE